MDNLNNMTNSELLSDYRHIATHLRKIQDDAAFKYDPITAQHALINEIIRLSIVAQNNRDHTLNLERALTNFIR